jgi:hypothetical protein
MINSFFISNVSVNYIIQDVIFIEDEHSNTYLQVVYKEHILVERVCKGREIFQVDYLNFL